MPLQPLRARALCLLVRRAGEVVSREELISELWGETRVDYDKSLRPIIRNLRDILGDSAREPRYLATVRGAGYRFIADVTPVLRTRQRPRLAWPLIALLIALPVVVSPFWIEPTQLQSPRQRVSVVPSAGDHGSHLLALDLALDLQERYGDSLEMVSSTPFPTAAEGWDASDHRLDLLEADYVLAARLERTTTKAVVISELLDGENRHVRRAWRQRIPAAGRDQVSSQLNDYLFRDIAGPPRERSRRAELEGERTLYLGTLSHLPLGSSLDYSKALHLAETLADLRPDSAEALGLLAFAHLDLWISELQEESARQGIQAARRALDLDPGEARALTAMAVFSFHIERDSVVARRFLTRALERSPDEPRLWTLVMELELALGNPAAARAAARRASRLAPLAPLPAIEVGWILYATREWDAALEHSQKILDLYNCCDPPRMVRLHILQHRGQWEKLAHEMRIYLEVHQVPEAEADRIVAAVEENQDPSLFWQHRTAQLLEVQERIPIYPEYLALGYAAARDDEAAIHWLRRSWEKKTPSTATVLSFPIFDRFRSLPSFQSLQDEVNRTLGLGRPLPRAPR
ncbi:MAG: winged helix-turn-helix domain-containing protein [Holophagales bacterium]|nr:winged helix-turn-helix domain-containing protein [Holophagales bacterium]